MFSYVGPRRQLWLVLHRTLVGGRARPEGAVVARARLSPFLRIGYAGPPHARMSPCLASPSHLFPAVGSGGLGMDGCPLCHLGQSAVPSEAVTCGTREGAVSWDPRGSLSGPQCPPLQREVDLRELRVRRDPRGRAVQGSLCVGRSAPAVLRSPHSSCWNPSSSRGTFPPRGPVRSRRGRAAGAHACLPSVP